MADELGRVYTTISDAGRRVHTLRIQDRNFTILESSSDLWVDRWIGSVLQELHQVRLRVSLDVVYASDDLEDILSTIILCYGDRCLIYRVGNLGALSPRFWEIMRNPGNIVLVGERIANKVNLINNTFFANHDEVASPFVDVPLGYRDRYEAIHHVNLGEQITNQDIWVRRHDQECVSLLSVDWYDCASHG